MQSLEEMKHNQSDRLRAMDLAQEYGTKLYTGIFYRNPNPLPTYDELVRRRVEELGPAAVPKSEILNNFVPR
jgi:2-oxoglutarate ferredoxin oxidoreductase subunit beta